MKTLLTAVALVLPLLALPSAARADDVTALWAKHCKACHGEDGKPTPKGQKDKAQDQTDPAWQSKTTDDQIKAVITDGSKDNKKMKAYKEKLSAADIDAMVKYIRTFKK